jgi:hypothetical protein
MAMKLWYGFGSEHSMNLVLIGRFEETSAAAMAKRVIDRLTAQVNADVEAGRMEIGELPDRYTDDMRNLLMDVNIMIIGLNELEQFVYDVAVEVEDNQVVITTDESDVSAFLKVLIDKGARVEVYSAHDFPGTGYGRGE